MSLSGALFDGQKLLDVSRNIICLKSAAEVTQKITDWAEQFDTDFAALLNKDKDFTGKVFAIDRDVPKPRKDLAKWSDAKEYSAYFFDETFVPCYEPLPGKIDSETAAKLLEAYLKVYDPADEQSEWFEKIKGICPEFGFAPDMKAYKADPDSYKGNPGEVSTVIRMAVTGRTNTPDLCGIMKALGDVAIKRIEAAIAYYLK